MTGDSELVEKIRIRNVAKDDREDCILNEDSEVFIFSLLLQSCFLGLN